MKALTTQIAERKAWLIENHKCVVADFSPLTFFRENGELDEEKTLSAINKYSKSKGFKESHEIRESGRPARVKRNNGAFVEGSDEGRVEKAMRVHKMTIREASIFCGLKDPGPNARPSAKFDEGLRNRWKKHLGNLISESDLTQLVERGIEPK